MINFLDLALVIVAALSGLLFLTAVGLKRENRPPDEYYEGQH